MSQNSASPPIDAMNAIFSPSGDQPNSLSLASSGRPVRSSPGAPPSIEVIQILPSALWAIFEPFGE